MMRAARHAAFRAPDGTSTLITRGFLDLAQRGVWPIDAFGTRDATPPGVVPGEWVDVAIELEATTWVLVPGHRLRLAVAGTDWPNCWPPAHPLTFSVQRDSIRLDLPTVAELPAVRDPFGAAPGPGDSDAEGVEWRYETNVLAREARVHTRYGGPYELSLIHI